MPQKNIFSTTAAFTTSTPIVGSLSQEEQTDSSTLELSPLKKTYPIGSIVNAFITNVHNVSQLRFFMFVKNAANAQHFANMHDITTPPVAYKCLRMPGEGVVFGLRMGESTVVRAVRLRTMCITTIREVFLPDVGRNQVLESRNTDMYHLPLKLRKAPGIAVCCQLRGINDDVTIVPDNMRTLFKGLLFRSVKLRIDGYVGAILKVQLLDVSVEDLKMWSSELGQEQSDFIYALEKVTVVPKELTYKEKTKAIAKKKKSFYAIKMDSYNETPKRLKDGFNAFKNLPPIKEVSPHKSDNLNDNIGSHGDNNDNDDDTTDSDETEEFSLTDGTDTTDDSDDSDNGSDSDDEIKKVCENEPNKSIISIDIAELFEMGKTPEETVPTSPLPSPSTTPSPASSTLSSASSPMITPPSVASSSPPSSWYSWFTAFNSVYCSVTSLDDNNIISPSSMIFNQAQVAVGDYDDGNGNGLGEDMLQFSERFDSDWFNRCIIESAGRPILGRMLGENYNIMDTTDTRAVLGRASSILRPILGSLTTFPLQNRAWKRDFLPALAVIDNRNSHLTCCRGTILTITPTYIGQLERFFGVVHHRGECYMQHMWTEDEIPWGARYTDNRTPYIFDVVLAKYSGDLKWYRAKVVEIFKEKKMVRVFFVDYGGEELVLLRNLADLGRRISKLPFQATLFRLNKLIDATKTKNERALGIEILRKAMLKETMSVRVVKNEHDEIHICFEDTRFAHLPSTMIRKGFLCRHNVW